MKESSLEQTELSYGESLAHGAKDSLLHPNQKVQLKGAEAPKALRKDDRMRKQ